METNFPKLMQHYGELKWFLGDTLATIVSENTKPNVSPLRRMQETGNLPVSIAEANQLMRVSTSFSGSDRDTSLPWAMYAKALALSEAPRKLLKLTKLNSWNYAEFEAELRKEIKFRKGIVTNSKVYDRVEFFSAKIGEKVRLSAVVDLGVSDETPKIIVRQSAKATEYTLDEATELAELVKACCREIEDYLGYEKSLMLETVDS